MAHTDILLPTQSAEGLPVIRTLTMEDLGDALRKGLADFWAMPTHSVFLCAIYPLVGLLLAHAAFTYDVFPILYPLAAGFALIGPIAAIGLYELSRRAELGMDTSWSHVFDVVHSPSAAPLAALAGLLLVIFGVWIATAHALYVAAFGYEPLASPVAFAQKVLTTPAGHNLIIAGNAIGFVFAFLTASLSVISFPLLLDRNVGFGAAVLTSLRVVAHNPLVMTAWFVIVAASLFVGSALLFVGLAIALPVLGHATWHLYRKAVEPDTSPRPEYRPRVPKGERYAADFPVSLVSRYFKK